MRGGRPQAGGGDQVAVNSAGGEPCLGRGAETNWFTKGSCTSYAKGDEKEAAVSVAQ